MKDVFFVFFKVKIEEFFMRWGEITGGEHYKDRKREYYTYFCCCCHKYPIMFLIYKCFLIHFSIYLNLYSPHT